MGWRSKVKYTFIASAAVILWFVAVGCTPNPSLLSTPLPTPTTISGQGSGSAVTTPVSMSLEGMVKGKIVPVRYARLVFGVSGLVAKILVKEGDRVKAGDTLAELDVRDLNLRVKSAQDSLNIAKATLAQVKAPVTKEEIAAAQAVYESTAVALAKLLQGPTREELTNLKANLEKAQATRDQAQAAYDRIGGSTNPYIGMMPQSLQLQQASLDYEIAQANYTKATIPNPVDVAQAKSQLAQAEAAYTLKKSGPKPEDIALAQARVQQAETALEQAQGEIAKAKLIAPMAGQVVGIMLREGEAVQAGGLAATLVDISELRIETTELDEFGVTSVQIGQPVRITVDALPDKTLDGKVINIVPPQVPLQPDGNPFYVATIALGAQDPALRYGMTVRVDFTNR